MSRYRNFLFYLIAALFFANTAWSAQSTADVPVSGEMMKAAREKVMGKAPAASSEEQYIIGHGDILNIQVYGEGDMSAAAVPASTSTRAQQSEDGPRAAGSGVSVRIDGRISLKHIGDVDAVGFTLTQLADYLKELYVSVFSNPNVSVVLVQSNSQRYTVMGKVVKPGVYHIDYPINIVQVVARCGGFAEWAKKDITLVRKDLKKDKKFFKGNTLAFDYGDFLDGEGLEKNIFIEAGDILIVD
ncbi:MAG: polysaccharide biosynthesis/export family protein [Proteobacteria bacterium]|nr:polysaccharide biosynthesis/export family protein [Pseudomonadota bacterium]